MTKKKGKKKKKGLVSPSGPTVTKVKEEKGFETWSEDIPITGAYELAATTLTRPVIKLLTY